MTSKLKIAVDVVVFAMLVIAIVSLRNCVQVTKPTLVVGVNTFTSGVGFKRIEIKHPVARVAEGIDLSTETTGGFHCAYQMLRDGTPYIGCEACQAENYRCTVRTTLEGYGSTLSFHENGYLIYTLRFEK